MKKDIFIGLLIVVIGILIANSFYHWVVPNREELINKELVNSIEQKDRIDVNNPIKKIEDKEGNVYTQKEIKPSYTIKAALSDSTRTKLEQELLKNLKIAAPQIQEYTKVIAVATGKIPQADIQVSQDKSVTIKYAGKFLTVITRQDSVGVIQPAEYKYKLALEKVRHNEKTITFFGKEPEVYDTWTSPDESLDITSVEQFTRKVEQRKDLFQLSADMNLFIPLKTQGNIPPIYNAAGVLTFNPDGFISPNFRYGVLIPIGNSPIIGTKPIQYIGAGASFNILRVKKPIKNSKQ